MPEITSKITKYGRNLKQPDRFTIVEEKKRSYRKKKKIKIKEIS